MLPEMKPKQMEFGIAFEHAYLSSQSYQWDYEWDLSGLPKLSCLQDFRYHAHKFHTTHPQVENKQCEFCPTFFNGNLYTFYFLADQQQNQGSD